MSSKSFVSSGQRVYNPPTGTVHLDIVSVYLYPITVLVSPVLTRCRVTQRLSRLLCSPPFSSLDIPCSNHCPGPSNVLARIVYLFVVLRLLRCLCSSRFGWALGVGWGGAETDGTPTASIIHFCGSKLLPTRSSVKTVGVLVLHKRTSGHRPSLQVEMHLKTSTPG